MDLRILAELQKNPRASYRTIARALGLSTPTVSKHVRRMEDVGFIVGYQVHTRRESSPLELGTKSRAWKCSECEDTIHGPARTAHSGDKFYAFCCKTCQSDFTERFKKMEKRSKSEESSQPLSAWIVLLGASVLLLGGGEACVGHGSAPHSIAANCSKWPRPRDELVDVAPDFSAFAGNARPAAPPSDRLPVAGELEETETGSDVDSESGGKPYAS